MKLMKFFGHLAESLYTIGAVVVGGTVGAAALGAAAVVHGGYAVYRFSKKAKETAYLQGLNALGLLFAYPYGVAACGVGHLYGAYNAAKEK